MQRRWFLLAFSPLLLGWSLDGRSPYVGGEGGHWERIGPPTVMQWTPGTEYPGEVAPPEGLRSTWSVSQIVVRADRYVDAIHVTYRGPRGARSEARGGGMGGSPHTFTLATGEHVIGISGRARGFVDAIQFHTNRGRSSPLYGGPGGTPFSIEAPEGHVIIGFRARVGGYVDGFEAIFARM